MPREYQGQGRHDAPDLYGVLYLAETAVSAVAEQLARFRGRPFRSEMLVRRGHPLALVRYELDDSRTVIDLDDPVTLSDNALRPSLIATRRRTITQTTARTLFLEHLDTCGLRWWSTIEASWINVTLFTERAQKNLNAEIPIALSSETPTVHDACSALGLST